MSSVNSNIKYRPDIDGLRALAILPVVIYHAFPRYAPGGFVGVDIFFVISGFLISLIIFKGLINNNFSFTDFYTHRVKRIFPALILVVSTCYVIGWFSLLPDEFKQLGKHIAAGMGFVQNFVLWKEAGYFDVATELKPLMHLWSLAVEEQFYLIFPLLLWILYKSRVNVLTSLLLLCLISFILNIKGINKDPAKTFFLPQTRFWELMIGSVIAYFYAFNAWRPSFSKYLNLSVFNNIFFREIPEEKDRKLILSSILSFIGLLLILYAVAAYNHTMPYPGKKAVIPVLGASLLIIAGPHAWVNRHLLSNKVAIWIGLISYPLYLWHWPLLSFARIVESETPSRNIRIAAVAISFVLAALTYYLIEKRIRYGRSTWRKVAILSVLAVLVGYVGYNAYSRDGLSFRIKSFLLQNDTFSDKNIPWLPQNQEQWCQSILPQDEGARVPWCRMSKNTKPTIQIIGDSHGISFYPGINEKFLESGENVVYLGAGGCLPFRDTASYARSEGNSGINGCLSISNVALDTAERYTGIHTVILWSRGPLYLSSKGFYYNDLADEKAQDRVVYSPVNPELTDHYEIWNKSMRKTLDALIAKEKKIIFVLDNPELGFNPKSCYESRPLRLNNRIKTPCAIPKKDFDERNKLYRDMIISILKDYPSVKLFDAARQLCDQEWCWAMKENKMLYYDDDHLSLEGARLMANEIVKILN